MFSYTEAIRYLCGDPSLQSDDDDRRDEARTVITDAVWPLAAEEGDGKGEMWDWIAMGSWSMADLRSPESVTAAAIAAEWDEMQREARAAREE